MGAWRGGEVVGFSSGAPSSVGQPQRLIAFDLTLRFCDAQTRCRLRSILRPSYQQRRRKLIGGERLVQQANARSEKKRQKKWRCDVAVSSCCGCVAAASCVGRVRVRRKHVNAATYLSFILPPTSTTLVTLHCFSSNSCHHHHHHHHRLHRHLLLLVVVKQAVLVRMV